jgi:hypothetical protein
MKLSAVLSIAALAQASLADFYLYRVEAGGDSGYQISDYANPKCAELGSNTPWYPAKSDVSGKTLGITCKGDGCWGNDVCLTAAQAFMKASLACTRTQQRLKRWRCTSATIPLFTGVSSQHSNPTECTAPNEISSFDVSDC